jgi:hypothetical protein
MGFITGKQEAKGKHAIQLPHDGCVGSGEELATY